MKWWSMPAACAAVVSAAAAVAAPAAAAQEQRISVTVPMTRHQIVSAESGAGGSARAVLDNGQVVAIPQQAYQRWTREVKPALDAGRMSPQETLPGNCGTSSLTFVPVGGKQGRMATSWVVDLPTIGFDWKVDFTDDFGVSTQTWGEPFHGASSWATSFVFTGGGGPTRAQVRSPYSSVTLIDLAVCVSAGPSESAIIV
ncbi:hypothetical protein [Amycolatopsis rubida]|uniref:Secreted protein n=1 Tax=Amycolatopsis rubida TaxID=112413 RepID=A0A1I5X392_9PSEU|nr:hypothetical protein [Amycolatopsis rubida]SFQ26296.1 hypothetical protein SAMN05421854_1106 [Amycolatopsis rubida]